MMSTSGKKIELRMKQSDNFIQGLKDFQPFDFLDKPPANSPEPPLLTRTSSIYSSI
jgi:hypothetical protein